MYALVSLLLSFKHCLKRAVFVVQLTERLFLSSEDPGSNQAIGNHYKEHLFTINCLEKDENKEKRGQGCFFLLERNIS